MDFVLLASIIVLLAAPATARLLDDRVRVRAGLDAFVILVVFALIFLTLLPEAIVHSGPFSLVLAALGFLLPALAEQLFRGFDLPAHRIALGAAAFALIIHSVADGALLALAPGSSAYGALVVALLLHRMGAAIAIWWVIRPAFNSLMGWVTLAMMGVFTIAGYYALLPASAWISHTSMGYWQAFAAGSLLHVILHPLVPLGSGQDPAATKKAQRFGSVLGCVFIVTMVTTHVASHDDADSPTNHTLRSVETAEIHDSHSHGSDHAHGEHHGLDLLMQSTNKVAPLVLLIASLTFILQLWKTRHWKKAVGDIAPWLLLGWVVTGLVGLAVFDGSHMSYTPLGAIANMIWIGVIGLACMGFGARAIIGRLIPHRFGHGHAPR